MKLFAFLLVIFCACTPPKQHRKNSTFKSQLVFEISRDVFTQLLVEKGLHPCGWGGRIHDKIEMIHWCLDYYKEIDIEEARELLISTGKQFLQTFNADERICPYFNVYPFTQENIELEIFLHAPDGSKLEPEKIQVITLRQGKLTYKNRQTETGHSRIAFVETYEEAEAQLKASRKISLRPPVKELTI